MRSPTTCVLGRVVPILAICALTMLSGCVAPGWQNDGHSNRAELQPFLIFDRHPGSLAASDLPPRSAWPSVNAGRRVSERIQYQEQFEDRQGRTRNGGHDVRRQTTTRRSVLIER